jgi:site-specific DNA-methyltransferase (adenine-specific)
MLLELNKTYNENCLDTMAKMPNDFIDLVVTSPPYDNLRTYKGYSFDFESIAKELFRIVKIGGVVVWVVGDATIKGSETGTSFKQALYFKECGFNLHDTMIWEKTGMGAVGSIYCYWQNFEYMFIFSKGKLNTFTPIEDRINKITGNTTASCSRKKDGTHGTRKITCKEYGRRFNIWKINQETKIKHPAPFPEQLAQDHILSWSKEGDLVYDPFMGSGTVAKCCQLFNRQWVGSEISEEYCDLIKERLEKCQDIHHKPHKP